ncbi:MAG: hypothetical protein [Drosophila North Esk phasmavirus]|nr:MAG: hypothetical protein [Drosophila North Esk phasmavirus]
MYCTIKVIITKNLEITTVYYETEVIDKVTASNSRKICNKCGAVYASPTLIGNSTFTFEVTKSNILPHKYTGKISSESELQTEARLLSEEWQCEYLEVYHSFADILHSVGIYYGTGITSRVGGQCGITG